MSKKRALVKIEWEDTLTGDHGTWEESDFASVWKNDNGKWDLFMWQDGNYSCDCNRKIFFTGLDLDESSCGNKRFIIRKLWLRPENETEYIENDYAEEPEIWIG
jgi:hypothetical protein